jgi:hypothetical protein
MIDRYMTIIELAEKWGITPRRIRVMCANGQIEGTAKFGRETTGQYKKWRKKKL